MTTKQVYGSFVVGPTDNRMTAKRYGFEYVIRCDKTLFLQVFRLKDICNNHLGDYCLLPLTRWVRKNINQFKFMIKYGKQGENSNLYFRNREDAESMLTMYAMEYGKFE